MPNLAAIRSRLAASPVFGAKAAIPAVGEIFGDAFEAFGIANGDDAAAIPDGQGGWLLLAAEGVLPELVEHNPELAGRSAVLANVNDIYAMGGRPTAMVDVVESCDAGQLSLILKGMRDNALRFGVPVVGGHLQPRTGSSSLSLAILGRAKRLVSSFDANPGDELVLVTRLDGFWLEKENYWNCTLPRHDPVLVRDLDLVPQAAEAGLVKAGKDVSMAGVAGTLVMLCETSGVGAVLDLDAVRLPEGRDRATDMAAWLSAFFSYGFIFAVHPEKLDSTLHHFTRHGVHAARIGSFTEGSTVSLAMAGDTLPLHDWKDRPFTGMGASQ